MIFVIKPMMFMLVNLGYGTLPTDLHTQSNHGIIEVELLFRTGKHFLVKSDPRH